MPTKKPSAKQLAARAKFVKMVRAKAAKSKAAKKKTVKKAAKKKTIKQTGTSNKVYDKRFSAKPPGKRKSKSGNIYIENRANRSDKGRLLGISTVSQSDIDFWIKMFAPRKRSTQLGWYKELINSFKTDRFNIFTPKEKGEAQLRALELILNKKPLQIK